jgi:hypothetical protein
MMHTYSKFLKVPQDSYHTSTRNFYLVSRIAWFLQRIGFGYQTSSACGVEIMGHVGSAAGRKITISDWVLIINWVANSFIHLLQISVYLLFSIDFATQLNAVLVLLTVAMID